MRARAILLVLAVVLLAGFAAQNWTEITRPVPLTFGVLQQSAPLGLILLVLLGVAAILFIGYAGSLRTRHLLESRDHARALHAQRELADKAEASRFTDLRQMLDTHMRESRQREATMNAELDKRLGQHHRELRDELQRLTQLMSGRLTQMERHLEPPGPGLDPMRPRPAMPVEDRTVIERRPADEPVMEAPRERIIEPDPGPGSNPIRRWFGR
jgi:uncharacterized integral membrane protein